MHLFFWKKKRITILYILEVFSIVLGIVLIWRGTWNLLDYVDVLFFNSNHLFTSVGGIVLGFLLLYLPDEDLKELTSH